MQHLQAYLSFFFLFCSTNVFFKTFTSKPNKNPPFPFFFPPPSPPRIKRSVGSKLVKSKFNPTPSRKIIGGASAVLASHNEYLI